MSTHPVENPKKKGWLWAYRKVRGFGFSRTAAFYRATRYTVFGDSGRIESKSRWEKYRLKK